MSNFYDSIIFDLDGTLWDATEASAIGWNSALIKENLSEFCVDSDDIKNICGLPFAECFLKWTPWSRQKCTEFKLHIHLQIQLVDAAPF